MNLHEHQAKTLFKSYDLPTSNFFVANTVDDAPTYDASTFPVNVVIPVTNKVLVVVNPTTPISSLNVEEPVTLKISSIVVVPQAESIV